MAEKPNEELADSFRRAFRGEPDCHLAAAKIESCPEPLWMYFLAHSGFHGAQFPGLGENRLERLERLLREGEQVVRAALDEKRKAERRNQCAYDAILAERGVRFMRGARQRVVDEWNGSVDDAARRQEEGDD